MGIKSLIEGYIIKKGVKRAIHFIVAAVVGYATSSQVAPLLAQYGVSIDQEQLKDALTVAVGGAFAWLINWVKFKTGAKALQ